MAKKNKQVGSMVEITMLLVALAGLAVIVAIGVSLALSIEQPATVYFAPPTVEPAPASPLATS